MVTRSKNRLWRKSLDRLGFHGYTIKDKIYDDLFRNREVSLKENIWCYRRGFLGNSKIRLGVDEGNYHRYVPELPYAKAYPITDPILRKTIEDKLTFRYFFDQHSSALPEYYGYLNQGNLFPLVDWPRDVPRNDASIHALLTRFGTLALKQVHGSLGKGFHKVSLQNGVFTLDSCLISREKLDSVVSRLNNYVITEYVRSQQFLRRLHDRSANAIRLLILGGYGIPAVVAGAFLRIGTDRSGETDGPWVGAVLCGIDIEDGSIVSPKRYERARLVDCEVHPDTRVRIEGQIPQWELIKSMTIDMFNSAPFLRIAGFDVVLTDSGIKILEINGHPELRHIQVYTPLMEHDVARIWFAKMFREKNIHVRAFADSLSP